MLTKLVLWKRYMVILTLKVEDVQILNGVWMHTSQAHKIAFFHQLIFLKIFVLVPNICVI